MALVVNPETGRQEYLKTCVHCKKQFYSPSKGTRYCSNDCVQRHQKKVQHQREVTAKQGESSKIVSRAYALCQAVGELYCPKPDDYYQNRSKYRWHHIDGCVLNNSPFNIICVEHVEHEKMHSHLPRVNSTEVLQILAEHPELIESYQLEKKSQTLAEGIHIEIINPQFWSVVNRYRVQGYLSQRDSLFSDLERLESQFKVLGEREFTKRVFGLRTVTDLRKVFKEAGYSEVLKEWENSQK